MRLSKRLLTICDLVSKVDCIIDVGTDHGLVAIELAKRDLANLIIASDNKIGPLNKATENINKTIYKDKIRPLQSDGLLALDIDPDGIIIAGMGSDIIINIILNDLKRFINAKYFILQPQTKFMELRYWLANSGFVIEDDILLLDAGIYYPIFKVRFGNCYQKINRLQMLTGFNYQHLNNYDWINHTLSKLNKYHPYWDLFNYLKNIHDVRR